MPIMAFMAWTTPAVFTCQEDSQVGWSADQIRRHNPAIQIAWAAINWLDSWKHGQESKPVHGNNITPHRKLNGKPIKFLVMKPFTNIVRLHG